MTVILSGCSILAPAVVQSIREAKGKHSSQRAASSETSAPPVPSREESSQASSEKRKLKDFGSDKLGYVKLPDNWSVNTAFNDRTDFAQYTEGRNMVMMWIYENSEKSAKEFASAMIPETEEAGGFNIETEWVTLAGYDAYRLRCKYPSQTCLYDWVFETEDGTVHFVAAQTDEASITILGALVESTYTLTAADVGDTQSRGNSSEKAIANTQRIGNSAMGYIDVPNDWVSFSRKEESANLLSYFSGDSQTILSVTRVGLNAKSFADESYARAKKQGKAELAEVKMGGYTAYRVSSVKSDEATGNVVWLIDMNGSDLVNITLVGITDETNVALELIEQSYSRQK